PLVVNLFSETPAFKNYKGGVVRGPARPTDHALLLVGWDDGRRAWKVKNSWGTDWGIEGFAWVGYGSFGIGDQAAWIEARPVPRVEVPPVVPPPQPKPSPRQPRLSPRRRGGRCPAGPGCGPAVQSPARRGRRGRGSGPGSEVGRRENGWATSRLV